MNERIKKKKKKNNPKTEKMLERCFGFKNNLNLRFNMTEM